MPKLKAVFDTGSQEPQLFATSGPFATPRPRSQVQFSKSTRFSPLSSNQFIEAGNLGNELMGEGNNTRARTLNARLKQQIAAFKKMANEIHHGSKEDLIAGIAESASKKPVNSDCDGLVSAQDLLLIAKRGNDPKKKK